MRIFNLAEELEKERKKNKELEEEVKRLTAESTHYESKYYNEAKKIDKAIEYIEKKYYKEVYKTKGTSINDLYNILKDDRK